MAEPTIPTIGLVDGVLQPVQRPGLSDATLRQRLGEITEMVELSRKSVTSVRDDPFTAMLEDLHAALLELNARREESRVVPFDSSRRVPGSKAR